eukprot:TRINITY_DN112516_c0_g1_i1.p1 TRINITY_DN112516_c0_g1~~TRINITY_DN112516_c0_g1_i1.p1  ORF type:complete len:201 (-),score=37.51 TRINITY_DN112516_c0_g1_i1:3-605(-)
MMLRPWRIIRLAPATAVPSATLRYKTCSPRAVRYRARTQAQRGLHPLKFLEQLVGKLEKSQFAQGLKGTPLGSHLDFKKLAKAGLALGVSIVAGALAMFVIFKQQLANQTAKVTAGVLSDDDALEKISDMVKSVLHEETTKKAVRVLCSEVLDDPQVHASLGNCVRGVIWHAIFGSSATADSRWSVQVQSWRSKKGDDVA